MKRILLFLLFLPLVFQMSSAQGTFSYEVQLDPISIPNLPGLHSYAFGQHNGKWLMIGGRLDGLHARQPFNAFPSASNNTDIYVIDPEMESFWSAPLSSLPTAISEQLQSTNMNFIQDEDTLYIIGGYAYSQTAGDHTTFDKLTSIQVSSVIDAVVNGTSITPYFKQISDTAFAVTGAQMGKLNNTFYLVGGHRFEGRYNPMGHATYVQTYTNQIRKFSFDNSGNQLSFSNYSTITDPVHLRRRDYNLLPQIFPNGTEGFTISSGVFQQNVDLPFLYPVDIDANGHTPHTGFNQFLSNYHSAKVCLFDSTENHMHSLFFGGMSQYYYQNGALVQDNQVPFVKTISLLSRDENGNFQEFQMDTEMPGLKGASAEFIPNEQLPYSESDILMLSRVSSDTLAIGHIFGGITSSALNPFSNNSTNLTSADANIYKVSLIKNNQVGIQEISGENPYEVEVFPNPVQDQLVMKYNQGTWWPVSYFVTDTGGRIIKEGILETPILGRNKGDKISLEGISAQMLVVTLVFDNKYYVTKKVIKK